MKQKLALILLAMPFMALAIYLVGCNPSTLPVTAPTLTPFVRANPAGLPTTAPTLQVAASSTVPLPIVTVESTLTQPAASQPVAAQPTNTSAAAEARQAAPTQPVLDPACLVGAWEVTNLNAALSNSQQPGGLALESVTGRAVYTFGADGNLQLTYEQLAATMIGSVDGRNVTAVQSLNGSALAHYQVEAPNQQVVMTDFGGQGIRVQMAINGQQLAEGDLPAWQAFTSSAGGEAGAAASYSRAAVTCGEDGMTLQAIDPVQGPEVQLKRRR